MSSVISNRTTNVWFQILEFDSKLKDYRSSKMGQKSFETYQKIRNKLLREMIKKDFHPFRKQYLNLREIIIFNGPSIVKKLKRNSHSLISFGFDSSKIDEKYGSETSTIKTNSTLFNCSLFENNSQGLESKFPEDKLFTGMHHIFDQHKQAVTRVHFANNDKSLLACCSMDGTLSICQLTPPPATVLYILKGHTSCVNEFEWSLSNDLIVSCSFDCTIRMWDTAFGECLRVIKDPNECSVLTCAFQPINNNMVVIGNYKGYIHVINVSTGLPVKGGSLRTNTNSRVQSLVFDNSGLILWAGDSKGFISSFLFNIQTGCLNRFSRYLVNYDSVITYISVKNWILKDGRHCFMLVNCAPNGLLLFEVNREMRLLLKYRFHVKHQNKSLSIRSSFGPLTTNKEGIYVVSGSEDCNVYFYADYKFMKSKKDEEQFTTKLQGHSSPVLDVCFNYDESLLATSDISGNVFVWRKDQNQSI